MNHSEKDFVSRQSGLALVNVILALTTLSVGSVIMLKAYINIETSREAAMLELEKQMAACIEELEPGQPESDCRPAPLGIFFPPFIF